VKLKQVQIKSPKGVQLVTESTDISLESLRVAENCILRPNGAITRAPTFHKLWDITNLRDVASTLGLTKEDNTCLISIRNEGISFLVFYNVAEGEVLGLFYTGKTGGSEAHPKPTLTGGTPEYDVLWKYLRENARWRGYVVDDRLYMGNGLDECLVFEQSSQTLRRLGDQLRPIRPVVSVITPTERIGRDAALEYNGITWRALEPFFKPEKEAPYKRGDGNRVKVAVVMGDQVGYYSSTLVGDGSAAAPYFYKVIIPKGGGTTDQLVNFVARDGNAQGVVFCEVNTIEAIKLFSEAILSGAVSAFDDEDIFAVDDVEVALTYVRGTATSAGSSAGRIETSPSPVVSVKNAGKGRIRVRVTRDTHPTSGQYTGIRIYVGASGIQPIVEPTETEDKQLLATKKFVSRSAFAVTGYEGLVLALEVPNEDGTYEIAPSFLTQKRLQAPSRPAPPVSYFAQAADRVFMSGDRTAPLRIYFSPKAATDEAPYESVDTYVDLPAGEPQDSITGLIEYRGRITAFTKRNAYVIDPRNFERYGLSLVSGALSHETISAWTDARMMFLSRDYGIYQLELPSLSQKASSVPFGNLVVPQSNEFFSRYVDTLDAEHAVGLADHLNELWWFWLRSKEGRQICFVYDMRTDGICGPIDAPQIGHVTRIDLDDSRIIGADLNGNLYACNTRNEFDERESMLPYSASNLEQSRVPVSTAPDNLEGIPVAITGTGVTQKALINAGLLRIATPWTDLGAPNYTKAVYAIRFTTFKNSVGEVTITVRNDKGQAITKTYGDVFGKTDHQLLLMIPGKLFQVELQVMYGAGLPFGIRSILCLHKIQQSV
jgi:hypothetical protein